jgi:hypothetical protein
MQCVQHAERHARCGNPFATLLAGPSSLRVLIPWHNPRLADRDQGGFPSECESHAKQMQRAFILEVWYRAAAICGTGAHGVWQACFSPVACASSATFWSLLVSGFFSIVVHAGRLDGGGQGLGSVKD